MWEKIAKEMALPWRAAEAMHWQIGEVEMANRANVPVFHLAGYSPSQPTPSYTGPPSTSAPVSTGGRSDESASPRSTTEGYVMLQNPGEGGPRYGSQQPPRSDPRRTSDVSSAGDRDSNGHRHSTGNDSQISDKRGPPSQYLAPSTRPDESAAPGPPSDGRRSPRS